MRWLQRPKHFPNQKNLVDLRVFGTITEPHRPANLRLLAKIINFLMEILFMYFVKPEHTN